MADKLKVTFNKNVKFNQDRHKKGDSVSVDQKVYDELVKLGVVDSLKEDSNNTSDEPVDYYTLNAEQLNKVNNDKLKAFLDEENIEYPSGATKPVLIKLILGEDIE